MCRRWQSALRHDAVREAFENVLHLLHAEVGAGPRNGAVAGQAAVWALEPIRGPVRGTEGFSRLGGDVGREIEAMGFREFRKRTWRRRDRVRRERSAECWRRRL